MARQPVGEDAIPLAIEHSPTFLDQMRRMGEACGALDADLGEWVSLTLRRGSVAAAQQRLQR